MTVLTVSRIFGKSNLTHLTTDVMFSGQRFAIIAMFFIEGVAWFCVWRGCVIFVCREVAWLFSLTHSIRLHNLVFWRLRHFFSERLRDFFPERLPDFLLKDCVIFYVKRLCDFFVLRGCMIFLCKEVTWFFCVKWFFIRNFFFLWKQFYWWKQFFGDFFWSLLSLLSNR